MTRTLEIPELSLVVLVGASGSGKSTFARTHFAPTQVLSSDFFRGLVADDENDQSASADAFDALHYIAGKRLAAGRTTVIDATNVQRASRASLVKLAKEHDVLPTAIVLDLPIAVCAARNASRPDRDFGDHVDRGPDTPGVLRRVMAMAEAGNALVVCGNHEQKLVRALHGRKVNVAHGLAESLAQLAAESEEFRRKAHEFCDALIAHYVL